MLLVLLRGILGVQSISHIEVLGLGHAVQWAGFTLESLGLGKYALGSRVKCLTITIIHNILVS